MGSHPGHKTIKPKFSNFRFLYDITAHAESGTGAKEEDNLFHKNEGLTELLAFVNQGVSRIKGGISRLSLLLELDQSRPSVLDV